MVRKGNKNPKFIDITGMRFGRWVVLEKAGIDKRRQMLWSCQCDCGNVKIVAGDSLRGGRTHSCGCITVEESIKRIKHGEARRLDNDKSKLYRVWTGMRSRCNTPKHRSFHNYGGRGISVCPEWDNYSAFKEWAMTNGYFEGCNIDRIDCNGNYEPNNCRLVAPIVNANNRRNNRILSLNEESHTVAEWARILDINVGTIYTRLVRGHSVSEALSKTRI